MTALDCTATPTKICAVHDYRFTESIDQSKPTQLITKWLAPWLEDQGFFRSVNERSVYCHPDRDLFILLYVDGVMVKGESEQIEWVLKLLEEHGTLFLIL